MPQTGLRLFTTLAALLMSLSVVPARADDPVGKTLSAKAGVPWPAAIAHRGASHDAPEETAPAYLLARDLGADYLELDLQRTKDGVLIAFHDDKLKRTTNVAQVFPDRADQPISAFTLAELKQLDAGSWFNAAFPDRARPSFAGLKILTLDEVIDIAEGGTHKPGLYIETKVPAQFPGIEKDLKAKLDQRGWLAARPAPAGFDASKTVGIAYTPGRVILQTFDKSSLELLQKEMPTTPKILLLWLGEDGITPKDTTTKAPPGGPELAAYYARQEVKSRDEFADWVRFGQQHGAIGTGPSAALANGGDQSYADLVQPWMNELTHTAGLVIHVYTVDEPADFKAVMARGVDGIFTNRIAELLAFQGRAPATPSKADILARHKY
ncbi:glycerophosphodiester phosphodiesterase [Reyranella sp. CPCC 100927]|uniref:glycerophosphodiester phosphodiesterase n=1 Tax=Reyranella sp. CPCC 100927 TaxID=2599616 RepID=UPI001C499648|nr:glycerophosphodiester phosphodiesterase [Reyranella sp. CPCC 100927]